MTEQEETKELRDAQSARETVEAERARTADDDPEAAAHERRAEKARYLRRKLEERLESETEAAAEERADQP